MKTTNLTFNGAYDDGTTILTASNTFAGEGAGVNTTPSPTLSDVNGKLNSFFGAGAGQANTTGAGNAFFGDNAGSGNQHGSGNSYFGHNAGINTIDNGGGNTFIGDGAGYYSAFGNGNTLLGALTRVVGTFNATAIGYRAAAAQPNSLILGSISGVNFCEPFEGCDTVNVGIGTILPAERLHIVGNGLFDGNLTVSGTLNATIPPGSPNYIQNQSASAQAATFNISGNGRIGGNFGIGTTAPGFKLEIVDSLSAGLRVQTNTVGGTVASFGGNGDFLIDAPFNPGGRFIVQENGNVGIGTPSPDQRLSVNGDASKVGGGSWAVFSDARLKNIHGNYTRGLSALLQLQPVRYEYKADNALGLRGAGEYIGFSAQAVERILPEAVTRSTSGYLQINNDPILWTMLNAVKEQQAQIERQQGEIEHQHKIIEQQQRQFAHQQQEIADLKKLISAFHPKARRRK